MAPLSFLRSGDYVYGNGLLNYCGSAGFYWSRTAGSATNGYSLVFVSTSVSPQNYDSRGFGFTLRCLARYI